VNHQVMEKEPENVGIRAIVLCQLVELLS